jgi:hypothetical protein
MYTCDTDNKPQKRPGGRHLKPQPAKTLAKPNDSVPLNPPLFKSRKLKNIKSKRKMSNLEKLPTELLGTVFLYCLNVNLPRSSPVIGGKLSSALVYSKALLAAFGPTWMEWHGKNRCEYSEDQSMRSAGDPVLQVGTKTQI